MAARKKAATVAVPTIRVKLDAAQIEARRREALEVRGEKEQLLEQLAELAAEQKAKKAAAVKLAAREKSLIDSVLDGQEDQPAQLDLPATAKVATSAPDPVPAASLRALLTRLELAIADARDLPALAVAREAASAAFIAGDVTGEEAAHFARLHKTRYDELAPVAAKPPKKPRAKKSAAVARVRLVLRNDEHERLAELPGGAQALLWDEDVEIPWTSEPGSEDGDEIVSDALTGPAFARARAFLEAHAHGWLEDLDGGSVISRKAGLAPRVAPTHSPAKPKRAPKIADDTPVMLRMPLADWDGCTDKKRDRLTNGPHGHLALDWRADGTHLVAGPVQYGAIRQLKSVAAGMRVHIEAVPVAPAEVSDAAE